MAAGAHLVAGAALAVATVSIEAVTRPMLAGDRAYVLETWLHSYRTAPMAARLPDWAYWSRYGHVGLVEDLLERSEVTVLGLPEGGPWMFGWMCHGPRRLHYVFVRYEFRRQGLGRRLIESLPGGEMAITHLTPDGSRLLAGCGRAPLTVNPYATEKERG